MRVSLTASPPIVWMKRVCSPRANNGLPHVAHFGRSSTAASISAHVADLLLFSPLRHPQHVSQSCAHLLHLRTPFPFVLLGFHALVSLSCSFSSSLPPPSLVPKNETHPHRVLLAYVEYFNRARPLKASVSRFPRGRSPAFHQLGLMIGSSRFRSWVGYTTSTEEWPEPFNCEAEIPEEIAY
jgi:hypothetical protein